MYNFFSAPECRLTDSKFIRVFNTTIACIMSMSLPLRWKGLLLASSVAD